jgi:hypothetical protein
MVGRLRIAAGIAALASVFSAPAVAVEGRGLYHAETLVTGTEQPERGRGFREGFKEVLTKLTGDARLGEGDTVRPFINRVEEFVEGYEYEDRMKGIPVHDEQGTRERPHFLRITYKREAVDRLLRDLGVAKWRSDRPRLAVWLGVKDAMHSYVLEASGDDGYGQRAVLNSASIRRGEPVVLPAKGANNETAVSYADIAAANLDRMRAASARYATDGVLYGTLTFDGQGYWNMDWSFQWNDVVRHWQLTGVTFDFALNVGLERAAGIFSNPR